MPDELSGVDSHLESAYEQLYEAPEDFGDDFFGPEEERDMGPDSEFPHGYWQAGDYY